MSDLIEKQAVIDALLAKMDTIDDKPEVVLGMAVAMGMIKAMPPALEQEPCDDVCEWFEQYVDIATDIVELRFSDGTVKRAKRGLYMRDIEKSIRKMLIDQMANEKKQEPCDDAISRQDLREPRFIIAENDYQKGWNDALDSVYENAPSVTPAEKVSRSENPNKWIPVSERLPELNKPLLVTAYHRVYYGHLISERGNYGYPIFRIHGLGDKNRDWVQETMSHEPYSLGRIDAWMYLEIPEPYKASPTGAESQESEE